MKVWLLGLFVLLIAPWAKAIDCNSVFPGPIQSFSNAGTLHMQSGALVTNYPSRDVCFARVTEYNQMNNLACGTGKCQITQTPSLPTNAPTKVKSKDDGYYSIPQWYPFIPDVILGETPGYGFAVDASRWDIGQVTISTTGSLSFSGQYSTYVIKGLTVSGNVELPAGNTYIIDGDFSMNQSATLSVVGSGETKLYIQGGFTAHNQSSLTGNSNLDVYISGDMYITADVNVQGSFYVAGNLTMENNTVLIGRVAAKNVTMNMNSKVIYDDLSSLQCYSDNFNRTELGNDWIYSSVTGSSSPYINSNRLNVTQDKGNQASSITYQRLFPGDGNLVQVEFDYFAWSNNGGTGGDGLAIILSNASITPQPGSYGGALGYAQRNNGTAGFAGGWIGVGLDEYGNFSNPNEGKTEGPGFRAQAIAIRGSAKSNYKYLTGTAANLSPTIDKRNSTSAAPNHKYRLTVDSRTSGKAIISLERDVKNGSGYQTLISPFDAVAISGQGAVPDNFYISLTASTGGSTNNHELDNFNLCALKSNPVGKQVDHFEFDHSGQALTCNPEQVTIRACADASCSTLVTDTVTAALSLSSPSDGVWTPGSSVTFTGGTTKVSLRKNTAGSTTIGVTSSTPSTKPLSKTLCRAGSGALSEASCTLTFADSGFVFDVPDKIANQPATGVVIKAVKKDDATQQCVPGFASVSRTLRFWSSYISPSTTVNPANPTVTVNGSAVGASFAAAVPIPLAFDATGQATLTSVNYVDAGQMQLDASYTGSTTNGDDGLVMTGSDQLISRPLGLCVQPETTCNAGNVSCPYFKRAGEPFTLTISGRAWEKANDTDLCSGNITTPNFALAAIPLGSTLVAPTTGVAATVGTSSYNHQASSSGTQTVSQSVSEVGVFKFTATPPSYLGMTIPAASSLATGRFTPYNFAVSNGSVTAGCGSFSYMDQPMLTSFTVTAWNQNQVTTANYRDEFATATLGLVAENGDNGVPLSLRLSGLDSLGWQAGLFTANQHPETFSRNTPPDGPFSQLAIGLQLFDNESAIDLPLKDTNMNATTSGACGSNCTAVRLSTQDLRHGRLSVSSGRAAVANALALPLMMESYTGSGWQRNVEDACTQLDLKVSGGFVFDRTYDATKAQLTLNDNSSTSLLALTTSRDTPTGQPTSATAQAGYIWLHFTAPGISDRVNYQLDLSKQPKQPTWLSYDWNGDGVTTVSDMGGWAFFNQWRSSDRVIYRREVLN